MLRIDVGLKHQRPQENPIRRSPRSVGDVQFPTPDGSSGATYLDVAELESGHTPRKSVPEYWENGDIPWLSLRDIRAAQGKTAGETEISTTSLGIDNSSARGNPIPDTRLMLVDYGTNLEVLVANQLLSGADTRKAILAEANVKDIHSCRCVIQLAHSAAPKMKRLEKETGRKGVQLTDELEDYLSNLQRCSTCYEIDEEHETYIFDFLVTKETRRAFKEFWSSALDLYDAFHKFAMLNDLVIPKPTRERFQRETNLRRFASRLPEPQDEEKVFRFEQVQFRSARKDSSVDYVSLSDGEHQRCQVLGTVAMQADPNVLFLMDEPESHFNPKWRVEFVSSLLDLPTSNGTVVRTHPVMR